MSHSFTWRYPADAWRWACNTIQSRGDLVKTEDNQLTREVLNLMVTVLEPQTGWPIPGSGWSSIAALDEYAEKEILSPIIPDGFRYSYGQRLFSYKVCNCPVAKPLDYDQIALVIEELKESPTTRRAIAVTWKPDEDQLNESVPCLQSVDFLFRHDRLHLAAYFRSWDVARAAPANMYGLAKLLEYVAHQVSMPTGSLTVMAASAHIYER